jgi:hypothetical protein
VKHNLPTPPAAAEAAPADTDLPSPEGAPVAEGESTGNPQEGADDLSKLSEALKISDQVAVVSLLSSNTPLPEPKSSLPADEADLAWLDDPTSVGGVAARHILSWLRADKLTAPVSEALPILVESFLKDSDKVRVASGVLLIRYLTGEKRGTDQISEVSTRLHELGVLSILLDILKGTESRLEVQAASAAALKNIALAPKASLKACFFKEGGLEVFVARLVPIPGKYEGAQQLEAVLNLNDVLEEPGSETGEPLPENLQLCRAAGAEEKLQALGDTSSDDEVRKCAEDMLLGFFGDE